MAYELQPFEPQEQEPAYDYQMALDGETYRFYLQWRERQENWYLSLYDSNDILLASGIRMKLNTPLGWRLTGRKIDTGFLILLDTEGSGLPCSYDDLGFRCQLMYFSNSEFDEIESEYNITIEDVP